MDVLIAQRRLFRSRSDRSKARYEHIRDLTTLRLRAGALSSAWIFYSAFSSKCVT